jgi:hypothetical protein
VSTFILRIEFKHREDGCHLSSYLMVFVVRMVSASTDGCNKAVSTATLRVIAVSFRYAESGIFEYVQ